jgi:nucleotide-binding universal stress UspA family protein
MTPMGVLPDLGQLQHRLEIDAERRLDGLLTAEDRRGLRVRTVVLTAATPAPALIGWARDQQIELIVMGTHGRTGFAHFFMGSVAQEVVNTAPCPVLTVRRQQRDFVVPGPRLAAAG